MAAASTSETSVKFYKTTRRNIPEDKSSSSFVPLHLIKENWQGRI
jgi:hypothetical protein